MNSGVRGYLAGLVVLCFNCAMASAAYAFTYDPPGRFLPGVYYEYEAQFYLKNRQYRAALQMFELAGYWGNKVAQYNAGIMYFNGIGHLPVDRVRGTAWLGIAAEQHGELADGALQAAWAKLTPDERIAADGIFRTLDKKYGDAVALPRAVRHYNEERNFVTGSRVGLVGNMRIIDSQDPLVHLGNDYLAEQDLVFNDYIVRFGKVGVGKVEALPLPEDARAPASAKSSTER